MHARPLHLPIPRAAPPRPLHPRTTRGGGDALGCRAAHRRHQVCHRGRVWERGQDGRSLQRGCRRRAGGGCKRGWVQGRYFSDGCGGVTGRETRDKAAADAVCACTPTRKHNHYHKVDLCVVEPGTYHQQRALARLPTRTCTRARAGGGWATTRTPSAWWSRRLPTKTRSALRFANTWSYSVACACRGVAGPAETLTVARVLRHNTRTLCTAVRCSGGCRGSPGAVRRPVFPRVQPTPREQMLVAGFSCLPPAEGARVSLAELGTSLPVLHVCHFAGSSAAAGHRREFKSCVCGWEGQGCGNGGVCVVRMRRGRGKGGHPSLPHNTCTNWII